MRFPGPLLIAFAVAACGPPGPADRARAVESGLVEELSAPGWTETTLSERMTHYRVPGLSVAVIDDFEISWAKGYGTLRAGGDERVTTSTLFQTASMGKPVVAAAALRLVRDGRLDLDEPVNTRLRTWRLPENELTARVPVTLRQLLSHAAGTTVHGYQGYPRGAPLPTLVQILNGEPPANSPPIRVEWVPGEEYRYSNGGYLIVQQLVTDVTGRPFAEVLHDFVCKPLGMHDSHVPPLPRELWSRAASGHRANGQPLPGEWHVYPESGASPFWSTPTDMARFGIAVMREADGASKPMLSVQPDGYGLGFALDDDGGDRFYAFHKGANEGFRTFLVLYPKRGQGAVIMTNGDQGDRLAKEVMNSLSREYGWVPGLTVELWMVVAIGLLVAIPVVWLVRRRR